MRTLIAELVTRFAAELVDSDRGGLWRLNTNPVWSDVQAFLSLDQLAVGRPPAEAASLYNEARRLYRGELLAGRPYDWLDEPALPGGARRSRIRRCTGR